jgi:hypothetical protein
MYGKHTTVKVPKTKTNNKPWRQQERNDILLMRIDFTSQIMEAKEVAQCISRAEKQNYQPRMLCSAKISFRNEGEIKTLSKEVKLRAFVTRRLILKQWLKGSSLYRKEMIKKES